MTRVGYLVTLVAMPALLAAIALLPTVGVALSGGEEQLAILAARLVALFIACPWLEAVEERRVGQRVGGGRAGEEQKGEDQRQLDRHQPVVRLQHQAQEEKSGARGIGHSGGMHAAEKIGHAPNADAADEHEKGADGDRDPTENVEDHDFLSALGRLRLT